MKNALTSNQSIHEFYLPSVVAELNVEIEEMFLPENSFPSDRRFRKLVLEAVDEAFSLLGDAAKQAIYWHLEEIFEIDRRDIPYEAEKFAEALEKILGPGAKLLEIRMMKYLYQRIGRKFKYRPEQGNLTFPGYLAAMLSFLRTMSKIEKLA
jgi:hypothetical protein